MPRSRPKADEIVEQLMEVVVGLKRRARADYAGQTLPYPQHAVLKRLEKGGSATTADLARTEFITPQAMGGLVGTLEEAGYVARRDDATDARRRLVTLTAAGRKVLATNRAARHRWLAGLVAEQFDADEQRTLAAALALLGKLFTAD
ncbi:MAG: MarR family transcriptional regulator [Polyangiaceae bacterium]|jgi:DNA-binding MarR family transcriptional regulator